MGIQLCLRPCVAFLKGIWKFALKLLQMLIWRGSTICVLAQWENCGGWLCLPHIASWGCKGGRSLIRYVNVDIVLFLPCCRGLQLFLLCIALGLLGRLLPLHHLLQAPLATVWETRDVELSWSVWKFVVPIFKCHYKCHCTISFLCFWSLKKEFATTKIFQKNTVTWRSRFIKVYGQIFFYKICASLILVHFLLF